MLNAFEGWNDLFVVGEDDEGNAEFMHQRRLCWAPKSR
jgi:hypothetical protein